MDKPLDGMIAPEDLERMRPQIEPGDIMLLAPARVLGRATSD